jgi:hypothetical protein
MQPRETRFVLRIESGDQQGDEVGLDEGALLIGRRPECGLVLRDASVSGKHAELCVRGERVELADLGSTNGTRLDGHKVERTELAHGATLAFGNVRATLLDVTLLDKRRPDPGPPIEMASPAAPSVPAPVTAAAALLTPAPAGAPGAETGGALGKVSAEKLTRSAAGGRRATLLVGLALIVALGAGATWYLRRGGGASAGGAGARVAVREVPGNLVADGTFEQGGGEWSAAESAPVAFVAARAFASTGESGLGVELEGEAWSLARSAELVLPARRALACQAVLSVQGGATGRLGLELASSSGAAPAFVAWLPARNATSGFEPLELVLDATGSYDRARVVVAARGPGTVALDDVQALEREPSGGAVKFAEYELHVLGAGGSCALLARSGRALLAGFDLSAWTRGGLAGWPAARLSAEAGARGFALAFPGAPREAELTFLAVRADADAENGWVATTGPEGYVAHGADFERGNVTSLLLGRGSELLRLGFAAPVAVSAKSQAGALAFRVALGGLEGCELQLAFAEERAGASGLADRATELEKKRDLGGALAAWSELLDRAPFDARLVARASEARARLLQEGSRAVSALRSEMERARFFLLPELFAEGQERALDLARQYRGSPVQREASETADLCARALSELSAGARSGDEERLRGVLAALDPTAFPRLAQHVRDALARPESKGE